MKEGSKVPKYPWHIELQPRAAFLPGTAMGRRVKRALQALENAGFSDVTDFLTTLYTHKFTADTECSAIQAKEWEHGIPRTLRKISEHSLAAYRRPYDMKSYRKAVTDTAKQVYKKELTRFNMRPDNRSSNKHGKKDGGSASERPWLQMRAEDADAGFLGTDVIEQTQLEMEMGVRASLIRDFGV